MMKPGAIAKYVCDIDLTVTNMDGLNRTCGIIIKFSSKGGYKIYTWYSFKRKKVFELGSLVLKELT